ncbi:MAG: hypothetical protein H7Z11_21285, partial [Verrucomicrobia bacterium]|nr:hypothetical protein [Leptolyngbya sp. ES-bin-22]
ALCEDFSVSQSAHRQVEASYSSQQSAVRTDSPLPTPVRLSAHVEADSRLPPLIQTLHGHQNWVRFLAYSPDGKLLASCSQDGTVKLWNEFATCLETLRVQRPYEGANITGVTGLTTAQKDTLKLLGAIESPTHVVVPPQNASRS